MERIITQKANYLADELGYEVVIITTDQNNRPVFFPLSSKVKHIDLGINYGDGQHDKLNVFIKVLGKRLKYREHFEKLEKVLIEEKADIVITTINNDLDMIPLIQDGSKKICEFHFSRQTKYLEASNLFLAKIQDYRMMKWAKAFNKYDKFVVLTEEDKNSWNNVNNIIVIPNFIDSLPDFSNSKRENRVICVGRAVYQKGFDLMLEAWAKVVKEIYDWHLYIWGNGDKSELEKQIIKLGIKDSAHLMPATKQIADEYDKSSIYALSSRYEGLPMVLLEAMSHGLPIVSFACPCGPKDIINDSFGSIVPNSDVDSFAKELVRWMKDESLRCKGSLAAYDAVKNYEKRAVMGKWVSLFNDLLSK